MGAARVVLQDQNMSDEKKEPGASPRLEKLNFPKNATAKEIADIINRALGHEPEPDTPKPRFIRVEFPANATPKEMHEAIRKIHEAHVRPSDEKPSS